MFGVSGAQGAHPCLFCCITKSQMQEPLQDNRDNTLDRTLEQMAKDYRKFIKADNDKGMAKFCRNIIRRPILPIQLDHVVPPYLHILLRIVKKHHDLLLGECHKLVKALGRSMASDGDTGLGDDFTESYRNFVQQESTIIDKTEEERDAKPCLAEVPSGKEKEAAKKRFEKISTGLKKLKDRELNTRAT